MKTNSVARVFAKNLKKARLARHMTQADVAKKAGITVTHYARIERGESVPSIITAVALVQSLKTDWSEVLPL